MSRVFGAGQAEEYPLGEADVKQPTGTVHRLVTFERGVLKLVSTGQFPGGTAQSRWWLSAGRDRLVEWGGFEDCFYFARMYTKFARA